MYLGNLKVGQVRQPKLSSVSGSNVTYDSWYIYTPRLIRFYAVDLPGIFGKSPGKDSELSEKSEMFESSQNKFFIKFWESMFF